MTTSQLAGTCKLAKFAFHNLKSPALLRSDGMRFTAALLKPFMWKLCMLKWFLPKRKKGEMDFAILCRQMRLMKSEIKIYSKPETKNLAEMETAEIRYALPANASAETEV